MDRGAFAQQRSEGSLPVAVETDFAKYLERRTATLHDELTRVEWTGPSAVPETGA